MHAEDSEDVIGFGFPSFRAPTTRGWSANLSGGFVVARILPLPNALPCCWSVRSAANWITSLTGHDRLALIIVLDQFSRSFYRDTARAFAQDSKALALALEGLEIGHYAALQTPWEKTFFLLPLGHSEELSHLNRAVALAAQLAENAPPELRRILEHSASQARGHRDVIARFGRHPHRNAVLGRQSTSEELDYLANGKPVHTRSLPQ